MLRGENVVLSVEAELNKGAGGAVVSGGTELAVVVFR